jgi:hypothetical protein
VNTQNNTSKKYLRTKQQQSYGRKGSDIIDRRMCGQTLLARCHWILPTTFSHKQDLIWRKEVPHIFKNKANTMIVIVTFSKQQ